MRFKAIFLAVLCCCCIAGVTARGQEGKYTSPKAKAEVKLSDAAITVDYCAPQIHGRTIFGGLVPYDKVWRTGANAATTLKTTGTLMIGNLTVPAGTYTLYSLPSQSGWKLIVSKQTGQWGTEYNEGQDLGRVAMMVGSTPVPVDSFKISFEKTMGDDTVLHLKWVGVDASVKVMAMHVIHAQ